MQALSGLSGLSFVVIVSASSEGGEPAFSHSLNFSDARNSQYVVLVF